MLTRKNKSEEGKNQFFYFCDIKKNYVILYFDDVKQNNKYHDVPIKVNSNSIELTVHTSCYCDLSLTLC